MVKLKIISK